jgi:hypothetical protein
MDIINRRINESQRAKYAQYGYHDSGQTKESKVDFETIMASLNKINTDLISLSITVEKLKHNPTASHGTLSEFASFLTIQLRRKNNSRPFPFKVFYRANSTK